MEPNREQEPEVSINMQKITIQNQMMLRKKMMYDIMSKSKQYPNPIQGYNLSMYKRKKFKKHFWYSAYEKHQNQLLHKKIKCMQFQMQLIKQRLEIVEYFYYQKEEMKFEKKKKKKIKKNKEKQKLNEEAQNKAVKIACDLERHLKSIVDGKGGYKFYNYAMMEWEKAEKTKGKQERIAKAYKNLFDHSIQEDFDWPLKVEDAIQEYFDEIDGD